jgi:hypothetical protein
LPWQIDATVEPALKAMMPQLRLETQPKARPPKAPTKPESLRWLLLLLWQPYKLPWLLRLRPLDRSPWLQA